MTKTSKNCRPCRILRNVKRPEQLPKGNRRLQRYWNKNDRNIKALIATAGANHYSCPCGDMCFVRSFAGPPPKDSYLFVPKGRKQAASMQKFVIDTLNNEKFYRDNGLMLVRNTTDQKEKVTEKKPAENIHLVNPNGSHLTFDPNKLG